MSRTLLSGIARLFVCLVLSACGSRGSASLPSPSTPAVPPPRDTTARPDSAQRDSAVGPLITYPNGLQIQDISIGTGELATSYRKVAVHYTGKLLNGQVFDTSRDKAGPMSFVLGGRNVVEGFAQGIKGMRVGGKRRMILPPGLAYGAQGQPDARIPPNATLVFEVELMEVK